MEDGATIWIWPENERAVDVFAKCLSQWRVGFGGAYALDYTVFPIVAPREYNSAEWPEIFSSIQVMEQATVEFWEQKRKRNG